MSSLVGPLTASQSARADRWLRESDPRRWANAIVAEEASYAARYNLWLDQLRDLTWSREGVDRVLDGGPGRDAGLLLGG